MGRLQVGADKAAVPQRHVQGFVAQESADFIETHSIAQPRCRGKVAERVGMQSPMSWELCALTQAVKNLHQVASLDRTVLRVHKR